MDFTEKELNEYVSSDEEEIKLPNQDELKNIASVNFSKNGSQDNMMDGRAQSMIFKPFKPGKMHSALDRIPQSVQEFRNQQPLFQRN